MNIFHFLTAEGFSKDHFWMITVLPNFVARVSFALKARFSETLKKLNFAISLQSVRNSAGSITFEIAHDSGNHAA